MSQFDSSATTYDIACNATELALSNTPNAPVHCLTRGQSIGLTLAAEASFISLTAVLFVFARIARSIVRHMRRVPWGGWRLIEVPMDLYILSLFLFDFVQALGMMLDAKWVNDGKLEEGHFCTAQGGILQLGETGVAMATLAIAVHTFAVVWWNKGAHSLRTAYIVVGLTWLYVILFVTIGIGIHHAHDYETPTPFWCWIGSRYLKERITGEYLWFWLTLGISLLVYVPLYFWSRGNITVDQEKWFSFQIHRAIHSSDSDPDGGKRQSLVMLAYPVVYCLLVLPLSIVRWIGFVQESKGNYHGISSQATFIAIFIYGLSGFLNVLLFVLTRPNLLHVRTPRFPPAGGLAPSPSPTSMQYLHRDSFHDLELSSDHRGDPKIIGTLPDDGEEGWSIPGFEGSIPIDTTSEFEPSQESIRR